MNILVVCKLANNTLKENVLLPLLTSGKVDKIYVLRDYSGEYFDNRVVYLTGHGKMSVQKFRHIGRLNRGIKACYQYDIDVIIGILDIPHGFIGRWIGILTNTPYIHMMIAGHREFWRHGSLMEKIKLWFLGSGVAITTTGSITRDYLISRGININKIFIMPNLPDEAITKAKQKKQRKYDIISFSRIDENKNVSLLINALIILKKKSIIPKVAIAGSGDKEAKIKQLVKNSGLSDSVDFLGFISGTEAKINVLTDSCIFVSCSRGEGFPVSLIEAMICGCVPVVSNVGDIVDVVHDGENGFTFSDYNTPMQLVRLLEQLLQDPTQMERMSCESIKIKNKISVVNNGKIWSQVLEKIG